MTGSLQAYRLVMVLGLLGLLHAACSAAEWRAHARMAEGELLPLDIVLQALGCLVLAMVGVLQIAGEFKEIRATVELEGQSWETLRNRQSFYTWAHRGRVFSQDYQPPRAKNILDIPERFMS